MTEAQAKQKFLEWWKAQLGYAEGANNWNKYAENKDLQKLYGWFPQCQPWCDLAYDAGMIECFGLANASALTYQPIGHGSAACRFSAAYYSAHGAFYNSPETGDQIFFYVDGEINHTGVVESVSGGIVYTIEGNTSDRVLRRQYALGDDSRIAGYGRPKWSVVADKADTPEKPVDTPTTPEKPVTTFCVASVKLPIIQYGDKGDYVKLMQQRLMLKTDKQGGHPYTCGWTGADGEYGELTKNSLIKYQKDRGLEADGVCGKLTWAALLGA